jgi:transmembrane sensor
MENKFDYTNDLIGKYLAGEANDSEQDAVDEWIKESEENRRYFEHLQTIFVQAASIQERHHFDTDAAWNSLRRKLRDPGSGRKVTLSGRGLNQGLLWRIAASVVLIMAIGYLAYRFYPDQNKSAEPVVIRTTEGTLQDTLPDGSTAFLNRASSITFQYDRQKGSRRIKLEGEAFFDVVHNDERPFIIENDDVFIEDIGTTFNVKAFAESPKIEVFVETGEVSFHTSSNVGLRLTSGETGIYDKKSKSFVLKEQWELNILAYKTHVFTFVDENLDAVIECLNEVYETKIRLGNDRLKSCRLNVTFRHEPIDSIADIIAETLSLRMVIEGNEIRLEGAGCEK